MDLQQIKQLIKNKGEKVIIVEDGKPVMVAMSYEGYRKGNLGSSANPSSNSDDVEDIKEEVPGSSSFPEARFVPLPDQEEEPEEKTEEEMTLEDLPF